MYVCKLCGDIGWVMVDGKAARCQCAKIRHRKRQLEQIPKRFRDSSFESYEPRNQRQRQALEVMAGNPAESYFLVGPYGSGKTHLFVAQYKRLLETKKCAFRSSKDLMDELAVCRT